MPFWLQTDDIFCSICTCKFIRDADMNIFLKPSPAIQSDTFKKDKKIYPS